MILLLVRHGESQFNAAGRIQGQLDVPLSDTGRRQAAAVAERLAAEPLDALYCSPLSRALETAQAIAARHDLPIQTDDRLMEIHAGDFQGLTREEMAAKFPEEERRWTAREADFRIGGGETRRELADRGKAVLESIRQSGHEHVAVVAHGGILTAALKSLLEIPIHRGPFHFYNAAVTRIVWNHEVTIDSLNETQHLREVGQGGYGDL
ncbi:MAG: histidine phosphatase family protein [Pirellulales bacterium]